MNLSAHFGPGELALEDQVRSELCRIAKADAKLSAIFGDSIGSLDSATSPPLQSKLPRLLFTTLATRDEQIAGGDKVSLTVYVVFQFTEPRREFAAPGEPGFASLREYMRNLYFRTPSNLHLTTTVDGVPQYTVTWAAPGEVVHTFERDAGGDTILTIKWPFNFRKIEDGAA